MQPPKAHYSPMNQNLRRLAGLLPLFIFAPAVNGADRPALKICLLSASAEYDSEKSLSEFQSYLETKYEIVCRRAFGKDEGDSLPGIEELATSDLMIVFTRRVRLPPAQLALLHDYLAAGRPVIGLRT